MKLRSLLTAHHWFAILCTGILAFAFCTRLYRISWPERFYFDEVYHGFTATTYLHNDPNGYEFWQTPPEGVAYEWTHPPLAKLLMAGSMAIFGEHSFGWRMSSVAFGTLVVGLTGLLAHTLFRNRYITLLALAATAMDGLLLSMSRIAMNDMHFVAFSLASVISYVHFRRRMTQKNYRGPLLCTALFLGLALASKWTALYVAAALALDQLLTAIGRRAFPPVPVIIQGIVLCTFIPIAIYLASYTQFFLQGHTLDHFIQTQQQMWWYHTGLKATHGYQSRPLQWVFDLRPVWMHVDYGLAEQGTLSHIYNVGNPILFWSGFASVILILASLVYRYFHDKTKKFEVRWEILFVLLLYGMLWVPWLLSPRIMFFYHYAPALPFLCIAFAYAGGTLFENTAYTRWVIPSLLALMLATFVFLYPLNTGLFMPQAYFDTIFALFPMWR